MIRSVATVLTLLLLVGVAAVVRPTAQTDAQSVFDEAVDAFMDARIDESAAAFDTLVELVPGFTPRLWQRGIVLYYAARYQDCREQFESHRTVNPNDVENATWHYLCVARLESADAARAALLPVGPDSRVPMREVYELYAGRMTPEEVLAAAGDGMSGRFYAHLYLGLYAEAQGDDATARTHIEAAAAPEFGRAGGYMYEVARVHLALLDRAR